MPKKNDNYHLKPALSSAWVRQYSFKPSALMRIICFFPFSISVILSTVLFINFNQIVKLILLMFFIDCINIIIMKKRIVKNPIIVHSEVYVQTTTENKIIYFVIIVSALAYILHIHYFIVHFISVLFNMFPSTLLTIAKKIEYVLPFTKPLRTVNFSLEGEYAVYKELYFQGFILTQIIVMEVAFLLPVIFNFLEGGYSDERIDTVSKHFKIDVQEPALRYWRATNVIFYFAFFLNFLIPSVFLYVLIGVYPADQILSPPFDKFNIVPVVPAVIGCIFFGLIVGMIFRIALRRNTQKFCSDQVHSAVLQKTNVNNEIG